MTRAVVLLSGGLDSSTVLALAHEAGHELYALSIGYGQRHARELVAARALAAHYGCRDHRELTLDPRGFTGSALTDADAPLPVDRGADELGAGVPATYVPARNLTFLALATGYAEVVGADDIYLGINALDYSVGADAKIWVRHRDWARLMPISSFYALPEDLYETMAVDRTSLHIEWRRVTGRYCHDVSSKDCFQITLERGQRINITEDHSLFTIDEQTAGLIPVPGRSITVGMPIVTPYDLSACADRWTDDVASLDLSEMPIQREGLLIKSSMSRSGDFYVNRLGRSKIPVTFPMSDDFLYVVGLWLAEGGKSPTTDSHTLAFSVGGIPGAADTLRQFFEQFGVSVCKSPANDFDYVIHSSLFDAVFHYLGLFGTAKSGTKHFPWFFWDLSQRQRRLLVAGLWDGDGCHVHHGEALFAQKSHAIVEDLYHCLILDGIFPVLKDGKHSQRLLKLGRAKDFVTFTHLYPLRHPTKRASVTAAGAVTGKDKVTGLWKCDGLWSAVSTSSLPVGRKTVVYNMGGKYDASVRAQRSAFVEVPALHHLATSRLAFLRVVDIQVTAAQHMYDLSVEGAENFITNGMLAHNSGYPDCRPEFLEAFARTANLATKAGTEDGRVLRFHAPLIAMSKAEIVREGMRLAVPWALTWSCYAGGEAACGRCDSCLLRLKGFAEAGIVDPLPYDSAR
jgi:7-cyano-7-deazaguanine synthase in queuosine biosynthesis